MRAISALFLILSSPFLYGQAGILTVVAGGNTSRVLKDGDVATNGSLGSPASVALDSAGNVYIADGYVRKVNSAGIISAYAGGPNANSAAEGIPALMSPVNASAITLDNAGNLYIAEPTRVRKVNTAGIINTIAGSLTSGYRGDGGPALNAWFQDIHGIAVDNAGNVIVADSSNNRIRKIVQGGNVTTIAGDGTRNFGGDGGLATAAKLYDPRGVSIDSNGNLFIADYNNYRIRKVDSNGIITTVAGDGTQSCCHGDGGLATKAEINLPENVFVDGAGNLYIADTFNGRIAKVDTAGILTTVAGLGFNKPVTGATAVGASINAPNSVVTDGSGNFYFSTSPQQSTVFKVSGSGGAPLIRSTNSALPSFLGATGFGSNMYLEIYGSNLSSTSRTWAGGDFNGSNAPTSLDGVNVTVNGKPAFVYYVSPTQININTPDDTATGPVAIQVKTNAGSSNTVMVNRSRISPTLQTVPQFNIGGKQYVAALTPDFKSFIGKPGMLAGVSFVTAKPGDTVSIYALGCGPTSPPTQAGVVVGSASSLALPFQLKIGGVAASVPFAGAVAGAIGLYQLNVTIPFVAAGDQTIELIVDGVSNAQNLVITIGS
jgi:uncharacterized protein (TIGR03437 family)